MEKHQVLTVLVADDEPELLGAVCQLIDWESLGFRLVGRAGNGLDALQLVEALQPDFLAVIQKCRAAGIPQLTFTGGEPTMRNDLVNLVHAAQWFVTRLNTNGRMLTSALCRELADASLDSVQVTLYSADEAIHNTLVGAPGYADTISGIRNAVEAGLNVSINTGTS